MRHIYKIISSLIFWGHILLAQPASFSFQVNGTVPAGFTTALNIAGQKWSDYLQITVPIKVNVFTVNSGLLPFSAITISNGDKDFLNAPVSNTLYPSALANQLAGIETNSGEYDMDIYFNLASGYYYGTGKPSISEKDFISTAMHEIGHGLGFYSDGYVTNGGLGSFGNVPQSVIFPLTPSFPWKGQEGVPTIFDKYIIKQSGSSLVGIAAQNSQALGDSIKNNAHYFNGPLFANASHSNTPIRLSGGAGTYTMGVDLLHIHDSYANTIMSYYWGNGDTVRIPGPWELGLLKEIGWNLKPIGLAEKEISELNYFYPNPASEQINFAGKGAEQFSIYNMKGELVLNENMILESAKVDVSTFPKGMYFVRVNFKNGNSIQRKVLIQ
ncbi:MAG: T9SS type A sorting domain-containing protein [Sphingobacteriaceae bacterium]|nr:T9SS type A sorting domain-containing protein [Sphingobacteriaceae bacterium]